MVQGVQKEQKKACTLSSLQYNLHFAQAENPNHINATLWCDQMQAKR